MNWKKRAGTFLLCFFAFLTLLPGLALADAGPKPSVVVALEGLGQDPCYVTLLSKTDSTGPYSVYDGDPNHARYPEEDQDDAVWEKFVAYRDKDGFYFLQYFKQAEAGTPFRWGYYPPRTFKILLYFPDSGRFAVSGVYERYAFDSYFKVDASNLNPAVGGEITAVKNYDYTWELLSLLARIVVTVALELGVALLFGFRAKGQVAAIAVTNAVTQTLLNVLLNLTNYSLGQLMFVFNFIWLELLVFAAEAAVYSSVLNRYGSKPAQKWVIVLYAFAANLLSFFAGFGIALAIPGIF